MKYGFDTDTSGNAVCAVRRWEDRTLTAGYLLFVFGSKPSDNSVCPDSHSKALTLAESILQDNLEIVANHDGHKDLKFAAACISDILQRINRKIYDLAAYLGQGIALGGAVVYRSGTDCIAVAFGGARLHYWDGTTLIPKGDPPPADGLVADALGTRPVWRNKYWHGEILPGQRLICTSDFLPSLERAATAVSENSRPGSQQNTLAMLLRKELEQKNIPPTAVLDIYSEREEEAHGPETA